MSEVRENEGAHRVFEFSADRLMDEDIQPHALRRGDAPASALTALGFASNEDLLGQLEEGAAEPEEPRAEQHTDQRDRTEREESDRERATTIRETADDLQRRFFNPELRTGRWNGQMEQLQQALGQARCLLSAEDFRATIDQLRTRTGDFVSFTSLPDGSVDTIRLGNEATFARNGDATVRDSNSGREIRRDSRGQFFVDGQQYAPAEDYVTSPPHLADTVAYENATGRGRWSHEYELLTSGGTIDNTGSRERPVLYLAKDITGASRMYILPPGGRTGAGVDADAIVTDHRFQPVLSPGGRYLIPTALPADAQVQKISGNDTATVRDYRAIPTGTPTRASEFGAVARRDDLPAGIPITPETAADRERHRAELRRLRGR